MCGSLFPYFLPANGVILSGKTQSKFPFTASNFPLAEAKLRSGDTVYPLLVSDVTIMGKHTYPRDLLLQPTMDERSEYIGIRLFEYPGRFEDISSD
jgi:hypothetical protein